MPGDRGEVAGNLSRPAAHPPGMTTITDADATEPAADPFGERAVLSHAARWTILGASFHMESDSDALLALAAEAYEGLPAHRFAAVAPMFHVELRLAPAREREAVPAPPRVRMRAGAGLLCGVMDESNHVAIAPGQRRALVTVSADMLARHPYHVRYELIEFAVYLLAARGQELVPLHGACFGLHGRGVLLLGPSGAGKSTLALHALLDGFDFLAEDGVFVEPKQMRATGVPNHLHVRDDSLHWAHGDARRWLDEAPVIHRRSGVAKHEADLRTGPGRLAAQPLDLVAVLLLSGRVGSDIPLRRLAREEAAARLVADQPYAAGQPHWQRFLDQALARGVYLLDRGAHPRDTLRLLAPLLAADAAVA